MNARSLQGNSPGEINIALSACMDDGFRPTLAIVFISVRQDRNAVCEMLTRQGIDVFGATSAGEFTNGHESSGEIALILLDINKADYHILLESFKEKSEEDAAMAYNAAATEFFGEYANTNPAINRAALPGAFAGEVGRG